MTKKERKELLRAIYLIHNSNEYFQGMNILAKLAGLPEHKILGKEETVNALEYLAEIYKEER